MKKIALPDYTKTGFKWKLSFLGQEIGDLKDGTTDIELEDVLYSFLEVIRLLDDRIKKLENLEGEKNEL